MRTNIGLDDDTDIAVAQERFIASLKRRFVCLPTLEQLVLSQAGEINVLSTSERNRVQDIANDGNTGNLQPRHASGSFCAIAGVVINEENRFRTELNLLDQLS